MTQFITLYLPRDNNLWMFDSMVERIDFAQERMSANTIYYCVFVIEIICDGMSRNKSKYSGVK